MTKVSVIVCTYSLDLLPDTLACLNSLIEQSFKDLEILLVMDRNEKLFQALSQSIPPSVKILINEKPGLSEARNTGVNNSMGDIIVFIDDDAEADKGYILNLLKNYDDKNVIGVGGKILPKEKPSYPEELYWIGGFTYKGYPEERCSVRNVHGCNMSFRREVFNKAGMFDTNLGRVGRKLVTAEETEFSVRVLIAFPGSRIVYDPSAVVYHKNHPYRQRFRYIIKRAFYEGHSKANIERMFDKETLSTENSYLGYLLKNAVPKHTGEALMLQNILSNIRDIFLLLTTISIVGLGYMYGKTK